MNVNLTICELILNCKVNDKFLKNRYRHILNICLAKYIYLHFNINH